MTSCLRITGRSMIANFGCYHQVLNRARWNPREVARRLLLLLVGSLLGKDEPVVVGLDDTIERRWGARITARGIYRDPVRSSHGHFVKVSGLRWLSFMLLTPLPWLPGIKALPFLTMPAPSERWSERQGIRHKTLPERARQAMLLILRWLPDRSVIFVGDCSFGTHELAHAVGRRATLISRLRLDASLFAPPEPRRPGERGRPRTKGKPLPKLRDRLGDPDAVWTPVTAPIWYGGKKNKTLEILSGTALWYRPGTPPKSIRWVLVRDPEGRREPQAFFSTDPGMEPERIIAVFVRRWQIEVTRSRRSAPISASRPRGNGRTSPSKGPPRRCSDSTASSACGPATSSPGARTPSRPPDARRPSSPSPTPSPPSAPSSGSIAFSSAPGRTRSGRKFRRPKSTSSSSAAWQPRMTWRKSRRAR